MLPIAKLAGILAEANSTPEAGSTLTFTADDTATVNVAAAGLITNTGSVSQAWSITPPTNITVSPSSGTLAAGATEALTITATTATTHSLTLVAAGATITGNPQAIVVAAAAANTATLTVSTTGTNDVPAAVVINLNGPAGVGLSFTLAATNSGVLGSTTINIAQGASSGGTTITRTTTGTSVITLTGGGGITLLGTPASFSSSELVAVGALPTVPLSLLSGSATAPYTFGQTFISGALPAGQYATVSGEAEFDAVVLSTWPDGSARHALISGSKALTTSPANLVFSVTVSAPSGSVISTSDLVTTGATADISFGGVSVSWGASDWPAPFRQLTSGRQMSSWHYRKQIGSDAHLVAWLEVRCYKTGAVEVMPWNENGYVTVASPTVKTGRALFTFGGTLRYDSISDANQGGSGLSLDPVIDGSGVLSIQHHTRHVLVRGGIFSHWLASDPGVVVTHDRAYLTATKMVPAYRPTSIDEDSLAMLTTTYNPGRVAQIEGGMGATGYSPNIGLLDNAAALYLVSGDSRAFKATMSAGLSMGNFSIHLRENAIGANQNRPILFADHANDVWEGGGTLPATDSLIATQYASSHVPSPTFLPFLLTGWHWFVEELQFQNVAHYITRTQSYRRNASFYFYPSSNNPSGFSEQSGLRAQAWMWRTMAQTAAVTPDVDATQKAQLKTVLGYNAAEFRTEYESGNAYHLNGPNQLGWPMLNGDEFNGAGRSDTWKPAFMAGALGYAWDLQVFTNATARANETWLRDFFYRGIVGLFGRSGVPSEFSFTRAAGDPAQGNGIVIGDVSGGGTVFTWKSTWGEVWTSTYGSANTNAAANTLQDGNLNSGSIGLATSYWGNLQPAIAYAVNHSAPGALAAINRMTSATNWSGKVGQFSAIPVWGIKPRADTNLAQVANSMIVGEWRQMVNTTEVIWEAGTARDTLGGGGAANLFACGGNLILAYMDKGAYDPVNRQIRFIGIGAGNGDLRLYQYDEVTKVFTTLPSLSWDTGDNTSYVPQDGGGPSGHGYNANTIDSATGDMYFHVYGKTTVHRLNRITGTWSLTSAISGHDSNETAVAIEWLPTIGAQGGLVYYGRSTLRLWDKATDTWSVPSPQPFSTEFAIHNVAVRNTAGNYVYIGGGTGQNGLAKVYADGSFMTITGAPNFACNSTCNFVDPVSGDLIIIQGNTGGRVYSAYTDTWSDLVAPSATIFGDLGGASGGYVVATPLPTYGVTAFVQGKTGVTGQMWLYKHA